MMQTKELTQVLADLTHIGRAVNALTEPDVEAGQAALRLILETATQRMSDIQIAIWPGPPISDAASEQTTCDANESPWSLRLPLMAGGRKVGMLEARADHPADPLQQLLLHNLAQWAAAAIERMGRGRQGARQADELNRLRRAGLLISSRLRLEETLEAILQMALEVTGAVYGIFRLVDRTAGRLIMRAIAGERLGRPLVEALPLDETSVMGWVAVHRQPVCIADLHSEPWNRVYYPFDTDLEMRSELAVPLVAASGRLEGVLNLESPAVGAFGESDSHLLQSLATQAVIAIQEVRLLDALQEVAQLLLVQPCHQVLARLVELACDLLNAAASAIWTRQSDELVLQAASAGYRRGERIPLHGSLTGLAVLERAAVRTDDLRTDPRFHRPDLALAQDWNRALIVPLLSSPSAATQEATGAFSVYSTASEPGHFAESEWDEKVLTCLAHYAALAVRNAAHQDTLRAMQEKHAVAETLAAVGDIAANALHHLNNKVGAIPVRVQGIQAKCAAALQADPYLTANLDEIERSAREAMAAVRASLSRLRPIHLAAVDVSECVRAAVQTVGLPEQVRVQLDGLDGLPPVIAGQDSLILVFVNLLENAATAMNGQGDIAIGGQSEPDNVVVQVSDNGPGIVPELHDRIFEFNFSGRKGTGKLGFGLWWVKALMVRLGGTVTVESDGRRGSTFWLRLPRAAGPRQGD